MQPTVIVIPCYNEAERLPSDALLRATQEHAALSLILVDDGSKDGTSDLLWALERQRPKQIEVLKLSSNQGKAEAVRRGMLSAFDTKATLTGYFDADLATPLAELVPMSELFDQAKVQLVMGARVQLLGRNVHRRALRHYLGRVFASSASLLLGLGVYDTQCGAKLFRNTPALSHLFEQPFCVNWSFDVELLLRFASASAEGLLPPIEQAVVEFPLGTWRDVRGSKLGPTAAFEAALELSRLWRKYRS